VRGRHRLGARRRVAVLFWDYSPKASMRSRDHADTAAAILLMGLAVLHGLLGGGGGWPPAASFLEPVAKPLPSLGSSARNALEWCQANVAIIHDVHWASACSVLAEEQRGQEGAEPDDSPECTLPDDRAGPLNLARARAEQQCVDEALAGEAPTRHSRAGGNPRL